MDEHAPLPLPPGRHVELPGRGTTFVRELDGPRDAPPLLLLHGWTATADLNFYAMFPELAGRYHVLAMDHRGHGRGIRSSARFRLEDCADDAAALLEVLDVPPAIVVGYSMGGPVAQLLWRRHRERVEGLVLCATSRNFAGSPTAKATFSLFPPVALAGRVVPESIRAAAFERLLARRNAGATEWFQSEMLLHDPVALAEAGGAIGRFTSHEWIGEVDVPTAVVVTEYDQVVPPSRQLKLAAAIPGTTVHRVPGQHTVVATEPHLFAPVLRDALASVVARLRTRGERR
ncbi:alpha/beta fold hydrolase [Actinomarinicola tropica]|uniref:Alpha/beta fold hydrolase n=1 Tax=Actinomarinicola tropica TaxID=2789776 RepID=A0A5Q2RNC5_9ACTN|nr:alpha/beta fold hydrolase [Actinomarinicola tropica]QGG94695.1 alpha/beta fold hydrolase [Actinomarinicola tropica]